MMTSVTNDLLQSALNLANHGFHVFPISQEKIPLIKGWTSETATSDEEKIENWWSGKFAGANVAISCGPSDICVVDVDPRHDGEGTIEDWQREYGMEFMETITAVSGSGGTHFYFKTNGKRFGNTTGSIGMGIDTKAVGGLVVAPFSIHGNGKPYTWKKGYGPDDQEMLSLPDWLAEKIGLRGEKRNISPQKNNKKYVSVSKKKGEMQVARDIHYLHISDSPYLHTLVRESIEKRELKRLDADFIFISAVCDFLGIPANSFPSNTLPSDAFLCVLPGHEESHPSASIHSDKSGAAIYHDWHVRNGCPEFLTLTDVYAAQQTGRVQALKGSSLATWKLRMLVDMNLIDAFPVTMPPLPLNVPETLRKVYEGFQFLLACKWLYEPYAPTPFTYRFGGDWCGVSQKVAQEEIQRLYAMKIVQCVGTHKGMAGNDTALYLPCATQSNM
jgi:hypothetical protein